MADRRLPWMFPIEHRVSPTLSLPFRQSYTSLSRGICNHTLTQRWAEGNEGRTPLNAFVQLWCKLSMDFFPLTVTIYVGMIQNQTAAGYDIFIIVYDNRDFRNNTFLKHKSRQMVKPSDLQNITSLFTRNLQYKQMYRHLKIPRWHF